MSMYRQGYEDGLKFGPAGDCMVLDSNYRDGYEDGLFELQRNQKKAEAAKRAMLRDEDEAGNAYSLAYSLGWNEAIMGDPASAHLLPKALRRAYRMGYRHGASEAAEVEAPEGSREEPVSPVRIVLEVDVASYRQHAEEQDGDREELARELKSAALTAISEMALEIPAMAILNGDGCTTSVELRDGYVDLQPVSS